MIRKYIIIGVLFLLGACKHPIDTPVPTINDLPECKFIPLESTGIPNVAWNFRTVYDSLLFTEPVFTPSSNDAFFVVKFDERRFKLTLVQYNYKTKEERTIFNNQGFLPIDHVVANNQSIFYAQSNKIIYQIGIAQGNLQAISPPNLSLFHLAIFNDGVRLIAYDESSGLAAESVIINTTTGSIMKRLPNVGIVNSIDERDRLATYNAYRDSTTGLWWHTINICSDVDGSCVDIIRLPSEPFSETIRTTLRWHPNNRDLYYCSKGNIYKLNTDTKEIVEIRKGCDTYRFQSISISPDGTKLLAGALVRTNYNPSNHHINEGQSIYLIDIDGNNVRKVL